MPEWPTQVRPSTPPEMWMARLRASRDPPHRFAARRGLDVVTGLPVAQVAGAGAAVQPIARAAGLQHILSATATAEDVVSSAGAQDVLATLAVDHVRAAPRTHEVRPAPGPDLVCTIGADNYVTTRSPFRR